MSQSLPECATETGTISHKQKTSLYNENNEKHFGLSASSLIIWKKFVKAYQSVQ